MNLLEFPSGELIIVDMKSLDRARSGRKRSNLLQGHTTMTNAMMMERSGMMTGMGPMAPGAMGGTQRR
jgi:hypothetical protein